MAVDDAHDATTAPVTPSDAAGEDISAPAPTEASTDRNDSGDTDDDVRDPDAATRSREAASYRTRLRSAEEQLGQRDAAIGALRDEVDRLHRAEAERLASRTMGTPGDLWLVADLGDLRDDDGRLDSEKVKATVDAVVADRPAWRARTVSFDGGARTTPRVERPPGLSDLLKPGQAR